MSSDDQATTEDQCSELDNTLFLGGPSKLSSPEDGIITKPEARKLAGLASGNSQLTRELRYRLKQVNKTMGRQGQTIANLRGELARLREEHSKIDRGELRRLERSEEAAKEMLRQQGEEIGRLREELKGNATVTALLGEANAEAERLREENQRLREKLEVQQ